MIRPGTTRRARNTRRGGSFRRNREVGFSQPDVEGQTVGEGRCMPADPMVE
jgi:hypothetical protein